MKKVFRSLDRSCRVETEYRQPDRCRDLLAIPAEGRYVAQGAGVSYAPLSFGSCATVVGMSHFNRILRFEPSRGEIEVEVGISLGKLFGFLFERGFYLPVQPGHPQITVGGCIACNVHGKNQYREGLFCDHVREMRLFHPRHGVQTISRENQPELFALTCGGYGLTGIVLSAVLSARRVPAPCVAVEYVAVPDLAEAARRLFGLQSQSDLLVSWHDLRAGNGYRGDGFIARGNFADRESSAGSAIPQWKEIPTGDRLEAPWNLYGAASMFLLNAGLKAHYLKRKRRELLSFFDFSFPISRKAFYYRLYGSSGFIEHQVLVPRDRAIGYLERFVSLARRMSPRIVLASMKAFSGSRWLLHFAGDGLCFSIDLPRSDRAVAFLGELDRIDLECGAIANLAKDSRVSQPVASAQYAGYGEFRERLRRYDPERLFVSELSQRLQL